MPVFGPTRAALAAAAARGADILPSLRLVLTAEALTAPPPPRQISCWTATAQQRYTWTGFAWRMRNKGNTA